MEDCRHFCDTCMHQVAQNRELKKIKNLVNQEQIQGHLLVAHTSASSVDDDEI